MCRSYAYFIYLSGNMFAVFILICLYFLRSLISCSSSMERDPMAEASEESRGYKACRLLYSGVCDGIEKLDNLELNWLAAGEWSSQETNA